MKTMNYLGFAIISMILVGFSDFWIKKGINEGVDGVSIMVYTAIIMAAVMVVYACIQNVSLKLNSNLIKYSVGNGIMLAMGTLAVLIALKKGEASVVFSIARLSLIVTVLFAFVFLKEKVTFEKILGIVFALLAIFFLTKN